MKENRRLKVVADANIPFLKGVLEPFCEMVYLPGREIGPSDCADADALLVRTRTRCDAALLDGSSVSFVASATIGTDHLDLDYLASRGIACVNAPGCNACGVMQYVHTALMLVALRKGLDLRGKTFGVVGDGNTGERVARLAEILGFEVLSNDIDPSKPRPVVPLEEVLRRSDILSFHLPLDEGTRNLVNGTRMRLIRDGAIFINASRGEVVDETALMDSRSRFAALILDVWQREPRGINADLVAAADIATPHIAGYSLEGKINGTSRVVQALAAHFGIDELLHFVPEHTPTPVIPLPKGLIRETSREVYGQRLKSFVQDLTALFPVEETDRIFRADISRFEQIRNGYDYRREFNVH